MDVNEILSFGVPAVLLVIGLVEFCKKLGTSGNLSMVLSLVFGVGLMVLVQVATVYPEISPWVEKVVLGLIVGLSGSGLWDWAKTFRPGQSEKQP